MSTLERRSQTEGGGSEGAAGKGIREETDTQKSQALLTNCKKTDGLGNSVLPAPPIPEDLSPLGVPCHRLLTLPLTLPKYPSDLKHTQQGFCRTRGLFVCLLVFSVYTD